MSFLPVDVLYEIAQRAQHRWHALQFVSHNFNAVISRASDPIVFRKIMRGIKKKPEFIVHLLPQNSLLKDFI